MDILQLAQIGRRTTEIYEKKGYKYNPFEAIAHAHAELSEVFEVLRSKKDENGKRRYGDIYSKQWYEALAEEVADAIISPFTIWEVVPGTMDQRIVAAIENKIKIVEQRAMDKNATS